ncbi:MAG TPA: sugar phosphorylase [Scandinavium sp.]|uniref:sugar phosphorylase n=1 Tax=Scandinavium sp. TaxID=2830653 RepID=UPI002E327CEC|nr:sugar phosphorylase [Scandinavium sp.]HEX4502412.1 sugar phosphorylase [Scandinavium sp.]
MNQKIKFLVESVYGETISATQMQRLFSDIEKAKSLITAQRKMRWDEKDVVLITYADQFRQQGKKCLPVFTRFYNQWLKNSFSHVHLLPFYPWSSDDGFSVIDYHQVAPESGDWQDVAELKRSASLMFDFVCNHMSAKSEWFARYLRQEPGFENFFIAVDPNTDLSAVTRPRALPLLTPFTLSDQTVRHLWTTFSEDQIDLNFAEPEVLLAMVNVLLHYLEQGADYVRLDAVGFMWKVPGTSCIHLPQTHDLIKLFRAIAEEAAPGTVVITETNVPHKDNIAYFGNGHDEAQMVYQFSLPPLVLHAMHSANVETLCRWANGLQLPSTETTWFNFLASHDGIGLNPLRGILSEDEILALVEKLQQQGALVNWKNNPDGSRSPYEINVTYMDALSPKTSSDDDRLARFVLAHAVLLSFPGVPAVYIQSILGSRNDYAGVEKAGYNRAINRQKYELEEIEAAMSVEGGLRQRVYQCLTRLIALRREHHAFHPDAKAEFSALNKSVLQITRVAENNERLIGLFNFSDIIQIVANKYKDGREIISGCDISGAEITLNPWQVMWILNN